MAPLLVANPSPLPPAVDAGACPPDVLASLGPVLCLHAVADPHPLSGLRRAARVIAQVRLDSDGPHEQLRFLDATGACCWRLHLLPDSDYLAWERLLSRLPVESEISPRWPTASRWLRSAAPRWRACAVRLHVVVEGEGLGLAASDVVLSSLGLACARRIVGGLAGPAPKELPVPWQELGSVS